MSKDLIKTLIVLALVIAGMAASIAFFTRPKDVDAPTPNGSAALPVVEEVPVGPFEKEGEIVSILSGGTIVITTSDGEFRAGIDGARVIDEAGKDASASYLSRGIRISVKGNDDKASEIKVISSPDILVFSPVQNSPVGLSFKIEGSSKIGNGDVFIKIKNRRTGNAYLSGSAPVSLVQSGGRYGSFVFAANLSSALDIMDGDTLDAEISQKSASGTATASASWRYAGGLASRIKVFFIKNKQCGSASSVDRLIDASRSAVRSSIEELIKGPSASELAEGYATALPSSVKIRSLELYEGVVSVDLSDGVLKKGPACDASAIRREISQTVMQFPGITKVAISVEGKEENPLNR